MSAPNRWQYTAGGHSEPDTMELYRALDILFEHSQQVEFRGLPSGRSRRCWSGDKEACIKAIEELSDDAGVYYCLNPIKGDVTGTPKNGDILRRRWLLVDIDPVKPPGLRGESSTDEEQQAAKEVAERVSWTMLNDENWPDAVWINSGNGYHLLWRIDCPNDDEAKGVIKRVLKKMAKRNTAGATVDLAVHNAARISKMPGTWARKGSNTDERPHRMAKIVYTPDPLEVVTYEQLKAFAGEEEKPVVKDSLTTTAPTKRPEDKWTYKASAGGGDNSYGRAALEYETRIMESTPEGQRNPQLNASAFSLGTLVGGGVLDRQDVERALWVAARKSGLGDQETERTLKSGLDAGILHPRGVPLDKRYQSVRSVIQPSVVQRAIDDEDDGRVTITASSVTPTEVEWLWPDRIPLGKLTTFAGWGGLGKSFVTLDIAARVSRGEEWPFCDGECAEVGDVVIISTEDQPISDTIIPRLLEAGADMDRVKVLKSRIAGRFVLDDIELLDAAYSEAPDCRLVIIDPASGHLGKAGENRNAEIRALLMALIEWAAERRVAVILVTHVGKSGSGDGKAVAAAKILGSVAWVNAVRAAHLFLKDPEDDKIRMMLCVKNNLAEEPRGLRYRLERVTKQRAKVVWIDEVTTTADEAVQAASPMSRKDAAVDWLRTEFGARQLEPWRCGDDEGNTPGTVFEASTRAGFAPRSIHVAKKILKIVSKRIGNTSVWYWPSHNPTQSQEGGDDVPF